MSQSIATPSAALSWVRVLAAVLAAALSLGTPARAEARQSTFDVLVVDAVTQQALSGVEVQAYRQTDSTLVVSGSTNSRGRLRLGPVPRGAYTVLAARTGNGGSIVTGINVPTPRGQTVLVTVAPGSDPWLGSAPLPSGMLAVQTRTRNTAVAPAPDNSRPVILASVVLTPETPGQTARAVRSDRNGWAVFTGLTPGVYRLQAQAQNGAAIFSDRLVVNFTGGAGQRLTFPLEQTNSTPPPPPAAAPGTIQGIVLAFDGTPLAGVPVGVFRSSASRPFTTITTNDRGEFTVPNLTPGPYRLDATAGTARVTTRVGVASDTGASALLRFSTPTTPNPRLGFISGNVIAGFLRQFTELLPGANVRLTALFAGGPTAEAVADDISEFGFGGLPAGRYRITASKPNVGTADLSVELRAGQVKLNNLVLIMDANPAALAPVGVVEGTVLRSASGGPVRVPGARIEIFGASGGEPLAEGVSGPRGEFRFDGLPAGRLRMVVTYLGSRTFSFDMSASHGRRIWPLLQGR